MPDAYESSVANLFEASQLEIPLYQRSYAWEPQQVEDLLGDIDYIDARLEEGDSTNIYHYFGTVVLDKRDTITPGGTEDWQRFHIIDGQQRLTTVSLLMGTIVEELEMLQEAFTEAGVSTEDLPAEIIDTPKEKARIERRRYVKKGTGTTGRHFIPGKLTRDAYDRLVVDAQPPDAVLENQDLVPAEKLARAKQTIQDWIRGKRDAHIEADSLNAASSVALMAYYEALYQLIRVISSKFELTVHVVPSADEAGRLFEAVNDRGRDITLTDKVRSYLIYAAGEFETLDTTQVARKFNEAVETVAMHADDDSIVDQFVRFHWEIFTGEHKDIRTDRDPSDIHRRIKHSSRHATIDRPGDEVVKWIQTYVDSLQGSADAFIEARFLDVFTDRYSVSDETLSCLVSLHNYNFSNLTPLMMALLINVQPKDDEFEQIVKQLEVYSFRVYQVMKRSTRIGRREFKEAAHRLYAAGHSDDYVDVLMGGPLTDPPYASVEEAILQVSSYIDSFIGQHCPDTDFVAHLTKSDILSGSDTRGWPGFCNSSAIRYLLYEYEKKLRIEQGSDSALNQLPDIKTLNQDFTLEHIAPQSPETDAARIKNHDDNVNRLGNLALLGPNDNTDADNDEYETKYHQVYDNAQMLMLGSDLPEPELGWSVGRIDARERDLVKFCLDRWSGESTAVVTIQPLEDDETESALTNPSSNLAMQIRQDVVRSTNSKGGYVPSRVRIDITDYPPSSDTKEPVSQCCGSVLTIVQEDGTYKCVCGASHSTPNYTLVEGD